MPNSRYSFLRAPREEAKRNSRPAGVGAGTERGNFTSYADTGCTVSPPRAAPPPASDIPLSTLSLSTALSAAAAAWDQHTAAPATPGVAAPGELRMAGAPVSNEQTAPAVTALVQTPAALGLALAAAAGGGGSDRRRRRRRQAVRVRESPAAAGSGHGAPARTRRTRWATVHWGKSRSKDSWWTECNVRLCDYTRKHEPRGAEPSRRGAVLLGKGIYNCSRTQDESREAERKWKVGRGASQGQGQGQGQGRLQGQGQGGSD